MLIGSAAALANVIRSFNVCGTLITINYALVLTVTQVVFSQKNSVSEGFPFRVQLALIAVSVTLEKGDAPGWVASVYLGRTENTVI